MRRAARDLVDDNVGAQLSVNQIQTSLRRRHPQLVRRSMRLSGVTAAFAVRRIHYAGVTGAGVRPTRTLCVVLGVNSVITSVYATMMGSSSAGVSVPTTSVDHLYNY